MTARENSPARGWLLAGLLAALPLLAAAGPEPSVEMNVSSFATEVGLPVTLQVTIRNTTEYEEPKIPEVANATLVRSGPPSVIVSSDFVGGRMVRTQSVTYTYQLTPTKPGVLRLPRISMKAGGKTYELKPVEIAVAKSEASDLFLVDVVSDRTSVYAGEELALKLQIWIRPFKDPQEGVRVPAENMVDQLDKRVVNLGPLTRALTSKADFREQVRKDSAGKDALYYLLEFPVTFTPERPGPLGDELKGLSLLMHYPVSLGRVGLTNRLVISRTREILAPVNVQAVEVKPLPTQGRPPSFSGAVGSQFSIAASATPTAVSVGDPIKLELDIVGLGGLEAVQAPPLDKQADLVRSFRVPTDPLTGAVDGRSKRFGVTIRALTNQVTEIPPIQFSYFDPGIEQYVTVASKAIPLKVKAGEALPLATIVTAEPAAPAATPAPPAAPVGMLANYRPEDDLLSAQRPLVGWPLAAGLAAPPLLFAIVLAARWRRDYLLRNVALVRSRGARGHAVHKLSAARHMADAGPRAAAVYAALTAYVADRSNLPAAGMTRADAVACLRRRGLSQATIRHFDELLERCELARFAAAGGDDDPAMLDAARSCVDQLEREKWS